MQHSAVSRKGLNSPDVDVSGVVTRGDFGLLSRDAWAVTLRASMLRRMQREVWGGCCRIAGLRAGPIVFLIVTNRDHGARARHLTGPTRQHQDRTQLNSTRLTRTLDMMIWCACVLGGEPALGWPPPTICATRLPRRVEWP